MAFKMEAAFMILLATSLLCSSLSMGQTRASTKPSDAPDFGPNVLILDGSTAAIQSKLDAIFATQEAGQFNALRYAILFKPGAYDVDVQVGFYTQVLGLGRSPDDVHITGAVRSKAKWMRNNNATCNFWRAAENLSVTPTVEGKVNVWAVSQATALRRVHINGDLHLWDGGWSSGGFLADTIVDGVVNSGSQQQWLSRNAEWGAWNGGSWNMVFVGVPTAPAGEWPQPPFTKVQTTPIIREKPYLTIDDAGRYFVMVPKLARETSGTTWKTQPTPADAVPIDRFYIARADRDDAKSMQTALDAGKHLLLTPGIYKIDNELRVKNAGAIVMGLGYATLLPTRGTPAITADDVDGVTIAGLLLDAGEQSSPTLLRMGSPGETADHAANPSFLFDIFCRTGGAAVGRAHTFIEINSNNVVGDNFWLWRADHGTGAKWDQNTNANGLVVNGNDVTIYGLFVEHTQEYQTLWNGNGGRVFFYQSELPYDPPTQDAWSHDGKRGWASYKVADTVTTHEAWGLGVYSVFHQPGITLDSAIEAPDVPGVQFHHMINRRLNKAGAGIARILNDRGEPVIEKDTARLD